jgi:hypothetical protein
MANLSHLFPPPIIIKPGQKHIYLNTIFDYTLNSFIMKAITSIFVLLLCINLASAQNLKIATPAEVKALGFDQKVFDAFQSEIEKSIQKKEIAGAVTLIARKGKIVHFESKGESQLA